MPINYTKDPQPQEPASSGPISLTKAAPKVSLTKPGQATSGLLRVNLNWNARPPGQPVQVGFLKRLTAPQSTAIDLDLGCLYELTDGTKGVVQALGNTFRDQSYSAQPIISLDGDDRSGTNTDGENLRVDLAQLDKIRRILVFAFIYEGVPNWAAADGIVTLYPATGPQVSVRLDEHAVNKSMCGIALLENHGGELSVSRQVRYVSGHSELDQAYGWGLRWTAARK